MQEEIIGDSVFIELYEAQKELYGDGRKAVLEMFRICKERNIFDEYIANVLKRKRNSNMWLLFDHEYIMCMYINNVCRDVEENLAIYVLITTYQEYGESMPNVVTKVMKKFDISEHESREFVERYWE